MQLKEVKKVVQQYVEIVAPQSRHIFLNFFTNHNKFSAFIVKVTV